jgi:anion-transporting  ArsA/GET3 family ATPase
MRRWAAETLPDATTRERLLSNAFFLALADRLATATDLFAAVRVAEWVEGDPALDDLVVDTAPGLDAIEFLRRPQRLTAFLEGSLVGWLRRVSSSSPRGLATHGARRVIGGLSRIGGGKLVTELADFVTLGSALFGRMLERVQRTQRLLFAEATEIFLVTAVREDAAYGARQIADALAAEKLHATATVLNRAVPPEAAREIASLEAASIPFVHYASSYVAVQSRVAEALSSLAPRAVVVPSARGLDGAHRVDALAALGTRLVSGARPRP